MLGCEQEYYEAVKNPLTLETLAFRLKMGDYYRNKECLLSDITLMVHHLSSSLPLILAAVIYLSLTQHHDRRHSLIRFDIPDNYLFALSSLTPPYHLSISTFVSLPSFVCQLVGPFLSNFSFRNISFVSLGG